MVFNSDVSPFVSMLISQIMMPARPELIG